MWLGMMVESILPSQADKLYRIQNLCTFINTAMQVMIEDEKKEGELNVETSRSYAKNVSCDVNMGFSYEI